MHATESATKICRRFQLTRGPAIVQLGIMGEKAQQTAALAVGLMHYWIGDAAQARVCKDRPDG